jgi:large subunit ribosomal protein L5
VIELSLKLFPWHQKLFDHNTFFMKQRIKQFYQEQVVPDLCKKFCYQNIHQVPRLEKIVLSRGIGEAVQSVKVLDFLILETTAIATQFVVKTCARKAISRFKTRKGIPVGLIVTLRGERIYAFLDRLMNLAFPRIRDFRGVSCQGFDGRGNYNFGVVESLIFPEVRYDQSYQLCGINIAIVTTSSTDEEGLALLTRLGIPFEKSLNFVYL